MNPSFGPWATAVATGANPQLNTFWKRRLAMLSSLRQSNSHLTGRAILALACLATGTLAIPTLKWATAGPLAGLTSSTGSGTLVLLADDSPATSSKADASRKPGEPEPADEYFPRPTAAEKQILDALEKPVDVEFQEMMLEDCLYALSIQAKIDIWIDKIKVAEEGVAMDNPVTLSLKGRRLESALNLILHRAELTYLYDDEVLKITTVTSAGETMVTRTYPVGDLCPELKDDKESDAKKSAFVRNANPQIQLAMFQGLGGRLPRDEAPAAGDTPTKNDAQPKQPPRPPRTPWTNLMLAISTNIEPDSWEELSGPGSMTPVRETNSLVIRQTWAVHRKVLQLLRDLRAAKRLPQPAPSRRAAAADLDDDAGEAQKRTARTNRRQANEETEADRLEAKRRLGGFF